MIFFFDDTFEGHGPELDKAMHVDRHQQSNVMQRKSRRLCQHPQSNCSVSEFHCLKYSQGQGRRRQQKAHISSSPVKNKWV